MAGNYSSMSLPFPLLPVHGPFGTLPAFPATTGASLPAGSAPAAPGAMHAFPALPNQRYHPYRLSGPLVAGLAQTQGGRPGSSTTSSGAQPQRVPLPPPYLPVLHKNSGDIGLYPSCACGNCPSSSMGPGFIPAVSVAGQRPSQDYSRSLDPFDALQVAMPVSWADWWKGAGAQVAAASRINAAFNYPNRKPAEEKLVQAQSPNKSSSSNRNVPARRAASDPPGRSPQQVEKDVPPRPKRATYASIPEFGYSPGVGAVRGARASIAAASNSTAEAIDVGLRNDIELLAASVPGLSAYANTPRSVVLLSVDYLEQLKKRERKLRRWWLESRAFATGKSMGPREVNEALFELERMLEGEVYADKPDASDWTSGMEALEAAASFLSSESMRSPTEPPASEPEVKREATDDDLAAESLAKLASGC